MMTRAEDWKRKLSVHQNRSFTSLQMVHTHTRTRKELDHCSDPLGTESHNMGLNQNKGPKVDLLEVV